MLLHFKCECYIYISEKVVIVNSRILEPKGTLGIVIYTSDKAPAKVVTAWPWHYDEPAIHIL